MGIVNLSDIKDSNWIKEEGDFVVTIVDCNVKDVGDKQVHEYLCQREDGAQVKCELWITPESMWKYKKFLIGVGHSGEGSVDIDAIPAKVKGKKFIASVKEGVKKDLVTGEVKATGYFKVEKYAKLVD
jgi:hypothetical protein